MAVCGDYQIRNLLCGVQGVGEEGSDVPCLSPPAILNAGRQGVFARRRSRATSIAEHDDTCTGGRPYDLGVDVWELSVFILLADEPERGCRVRTGVEVRDVEGAVFGDAKCFCHIRYLALAVAHSRLIAQYKIQTLGLTEE